MKDVSIESSVPLNYPPKKYCDLSGLTVSSQHYYLICQANYTDPQTKLRYHSAEVFQFIHNYLSHEDIERYLTMRNAQPKIR